MTPFVYESPCVPRLCLMLLLGFFVPIHAIAQFSSDSHFTSDSEVISPAQLDPSDIYLEGYLTFRAAQQLEAQGDPVGAAAKYRKAEELFASIRKYFPQWKSEMVQQRSAKNREALAAVSTKAAEHLKNQQDVVAELEGGVRVETDANPLQDSRPSVLEVDPVTSRQLKEALAEAQRLRELLEQQQQAQGEDAANMAAIRLQKLQQKSNQELAQAKAEIQRLRAKQAIETHNELEAERTKIQLQTERAKVTKLEREAQLLREQKDQLSLQNLDAEGRQLAQARAEIRRLKREATMARIKADAENNRLKKITGEMQAEANAKIRNLRDLALSAEQHSKELTAKLEQLKGNERDEAEKEIERLNNIAQTAKADANKQHALLKEQLDQSHSAAEEQIQKLREMAIKASKSAEALHLKHDLEMNRSNIRMNELKLENQALRDQRERTKAKLLAAEANARRLKNKLARAPLEGEVGALDQRIRKLEEERDAMALTLSNSQSGYDQAMNRVNDLKQEWLEVQQKNIDLINDMKAERDISNEVVAGQKRQIDRLQKQLDQKSEALENANHQIASLQSELRESRNAFEQLRNERDALLMERDQLANLLKLGEEGRIKELVDQSMGLGRQLREAKEKLESLAQNNATANEEYTVALSELAIAKQQIIALRKQKLDYEQRALDAEQKLNNELGNLDEADNSSNPREIALLKDIIQRQLRAQAMRRQGRNLLTAALDKLGQDDEQISNALALMDEEEIVLSKEEQKLIAERQVDHEFISPFARDQRTVSRATADLKRKMDPFDRSAKKAFLAGRYLATRELYDQILGMHPGHTPTLCKMGVVQLKLKNHEAAADYFRRASELDTSNAYALRMLSFSLVGQARLEEAEQIARRSVTLDPTDAKTQVLLGTICARLGNAEDAESHFKGAINVDPLSSEPYYNLALICSGTGRMEKAQQYYQKALERGALPDPQLEQELAAQ